MRLFVLLLIRLSGSTLRKFLKQVFRMYIHVYIHDEEISFSYWHRQFRFVKFHLNLYKICTKYIYIYIFYSVYKISVGTGVFFFFFSIIYLGDRKSFLAEK